MRDLSIQLFGSGLKIGLVDLNIKKRTAIFLLTHIDGSLVDARRIEGIRRGMLLNYIEGYVLSILDFGNEYIKLAYGETRRFISVKNFQIGAFGYPGMMKFNEPSPGYVTFIGGALEIREGGHMYIPDTLYALSYEDSKLSLYYRFSTKEGIIEKKSEELKSFNPASAEGMYVVFGRITESTWGPENQNDGLRIDSASRGHVFYPEAYVVYNDFLIESVSPKSIRLRPVMRCKIAEGELVKIKGSNYLVRSLDSQSVILGPALVRTLPDALPPGDRRARIELDTEEIATEILRFRRDINREFLKIYRSDLLKEDEIASKGISGPCKNEESFNNKIGHINIFIDLINEEILKSLIKNKNVESGSINLLERFLEEKFPSYNRKIIKNLRDLRKFRKKVPFHREEGLDIFEEYGFYPPYDWEDIWRRCLELYCESLYLLSNVFKEKNKR